MRLKLDENFDLRLATLFEEIGADVDSVLAEGLGGSGDELVYGACCANKRTLITLDLDFANPFRFPPAPTEGIVVVRPPRPVLPAIRATLLSVSEELKSRTLTGTTLIVEPGRIRVYDPHDEPGAS